MPRFGACIVQDAFKRLLEQGNEISWEDVSRLANIVGGEVRLENPEVCHQGIISGVTLEGGTISIMCPWVLKTPMDEDGDLVGDYMSEMWEIDEKVRLPLTVSVPKGVYHKDEEVVFHTANDSYSSGNRAVFASGSVIMFCAGAGTIFLAGSTHRHAKTARTLAPTLGLSFPQF